MRSATLGLNSLSPLTSISQYQDRDVVRLRRPSRKRTHGVQQDLQHRFWSRAMAVLDGLDEALAPELLARDIHGFN
jgi:hypothetical protein